MSKVPLFIYTPLKTIVHRLHPLTKLLIIIIVWIVSLVSFDIMTFIILLISLLTIWKLANISFKDIMTLLKLLSIVFTVFTLINGFMYFRGKTPLFYVFQYPFTIEGLLFGITLSLKVLTIVSTIPILTKTTTMTELIASLAKLRIPYQLIFILTTAMNFTDTIEETYNEIKDSQFLRGYSLSEMNILKKIIKGYLPLFVPLILTTLRKASTMDIAIESRAFGASKERTYVHQIRFKSVDVITIGIMTTICMTLLVLNIIQEKIILILPT
ncbi:MAG: energy-coupling factor transporter transmembrane component T [Nitrososphaerales archaeon]